MAEGAPLVTVVVPAWNESANLPGCLHALRATLADCEFEIVIVDDGSDDDTRAVAGRLADVDAARTRVLAHEVNQGLGAALRTGFGAARGQYVTCCPADFRTAP